MHKLLFLVTILLLLTFPQFFFFNQENANPNAHCQISVAFLEEASLLITQESTTEAEDERNGLFMLGYTLFECLIAFHVDIRRSI